MKKAKATKVVKKRSGRFMVKKRGGGLLKGADKVKALEEAGVVKKLKSKPKAAPEAEAPAT
jgi:hypothetical protein